MPVFFSSELETVATFWRVFRKDGVALGFTSHDRDLFFAGLRHRAAPGMTPAAIRRTRDLSADSAELEGALAHDAITAVDLAAGNYDEAFLEFGAVDWQTGLHEVIYAGELGRIGECSGRFNAELKSAKSLLERELVPRTSPTCRARFCGPGCGLSMARFTHYAMSTAVSIDSNQVRVDGIEPSHFHDGILRFTEGPQTGMMFGIIDANSNGLTLDRPLADGTPQRVLLELREGCDHTFGTCGARFNNAINFRGEPFLPGNDLLARYARPQ